MCVCACVCVCVCVRVCVCVHVCVLQFVRVYASTDRFPDYTKDVERRRGKQFGIHTHIEKTKTKKIAMLLQWAI